jgi:sugar-specific transcriptional regulator TrmB
MRRPIIPRQLGDALGVLGLTELEAGLYAFLLGESPATGYRVAQGVGKSFGSVYKTLEGLLDKGVVTAPDDSGGRGFRAVALEELLGARRRELERAAEVARAALHAVPGEHADELVYRLSRREQVLARAGAMLEASTDFCIVTATPVLADVLTEDLRKAAARAVHVGLKAFAPIEIPGVRVAMDPRGIEAVTRGPGEWLQITADGRELLLAIFDHTGEHLRTATWTAHAHLNWSMYTGHSSNFVFAAVRTAIRDGASVDELRTMMNEMVAFQTPRSDSKRRLMERFRAPHASARGARGATGNTVRVESPETHGKGKKREKNT